MKQIQFISSGIFYTNKSKVHKRENVPWIPLQKCLYLLSFYGAFAVDLTFLWFWSHFAEAFCTIFILYCKFDLRELRVLQEVWLTNCCLVPLRVLVCQHDEVTKLISTVVVSRIKRTRNSSIVLSFHCMGTRRAAWRRSQGCYCVAFWNYSSLYSPFDLQSPHNARQILSLYQRSK